MNIAEVLENLKNDPRSTAVILSAMYAQSPSEFRSSWKTLMIDDAMELARALHDYYIEKGISQLQKYNGESDPLGTLNGQNTLQFTSELPDNTLGLSRAKDKLNLINIRSLGSKWDQCDMIFETIPHEVAHLLQSTLVFDHGPQGLTRAGETLFSQSFSRGQRYRLQLNEDHVIVGARYLAHGKIWKQIYCNLTGFAKVKNRFFKGVTVSSSEKRSK